MGDPCRRVHELFRTRERYEFPYAEVELPENGIYALFEEGETGHDGGRIVRFGGHRGDDQLPGRLREHFVVENKDRSIFRKNIGRALLNREDDPFLDDWDLDLIPREAREKHGDRIDFDKQACVEGRVTNQIQTNFSFSVVGIPEAGARAQVEPMLIATVSLCRECGPSDGWLGRWSPKRKIREGGLWQEQHVHRQDLVPDDWREVERFL